MSKDFLLELGMEEMPAKFAPGAVSQMENNARKLLAELRLSFTDLKVYVTPRRLALIIEALAEQQQDMEEEAKGPAVKAAFDAEGKPTKAAEGFARGYGATTADLFVRELNQVPYVYIKKFRKGEDTVNLLPDFCLDLATHLNFPKTMRWGESEIRFVRPVRWLVALFGDRVVPFNYAGLQAGRTSRGHRVLGGYIRLLAAGEYLEAMETAYVLADQDQRKERIWEQVLALAAKAGGIVDRDEALLTEICNLVEYPTALIGEVDLKYMILPEEVITTPMKEHQRYFPVRSGKGKLLPYFITVRNGDNASLDLVREGNKKVLKARLEDASFYFREDLKNPLSSLVPKLDRVVYHEKLGTVGQRVGRIRKLAVAIGNKLGFERREIEWVDRTAYLAKADLVTHMVYDFPELQGTMGACYARYNGEEPEVSAGIAEHYFPRFTGDGFPSSNTGKAVSLADKLDAIVGSFGIGIQPTGSQDPYALRRQALGVVGMLMQEEKDISLTILWEECYHLFADQGIVLLGLDTLRLSLEDFFKQRLRFLLQERGLNYDVIEAVLEQGAEKPYSVLAKARSLAAVRERDGFEAYLNAYVRCFNLSKKSTVSTWRLSDLADPAELALVRILQEKSPQVEGAVKINDFFKAYDIASQLVDPVEKLFAAVMIMADEEKVRKARLGLLQECVRLLGCLGNLALLS